LVFLLSRQVSGPLEEDTGGSDVGVLLGRVRPEHGR
jgi:hypothetical protein